MAAATLNNRLLNLVIAWEIRCRSVRTRLVFEVSKEYMMTGRTDQIDFTHWDWLPMAAAEIEDYLNRLLTEASITPHNISARSKSIRSFLGKHHQKQYDDPIKEVTDSVGVRIITYSNTDRDRSAELIRDRFVVKDGEDRNPGDEKPPERRGYDCQHIIISGEKPQTESDWMVKNGKLFKYFQTFGGLEIQIRTVAAHAWAEFEHARRYKGPSYNTMSEQDKETIDQLFGAASDARSALDETFVAIDRLLAHPTQGTDSERFSVEPSQAADRKRNAHADEAVTPVDAQTLEEFLAKRFPQDNVGSSAGVEFATELVKACGLSSIEALEDALEVVDSDQVRSLMDLDVPVTRVRRLDDELLALFGQEYIRLTGNIGSVKTRAKQLEWRFDRLRGKTQYRIYSLEGEDSPEESDSVILSAAATVREVARIVANLKGISAVTFHDGVSQNNDLLESARAKEVTLSDGSSIWVATNLNRHASERMITEILEQSGGVDLQVLKDGYLVASGQPADDVAEGIQPPRF